MSFYLQYLVIATLSAFLLAGCARTPAIKTGADHTATNRPFRFTVKADQDTVLTLKLVSPDLYDARLPDEEEAKYHVSYDLDCDNDGTYEKTAQTGDAVCELQRGTHQIAIRGTAPGFIFPGAFLYSDETRAIQNDAVSALHAISLDQWGDIPWRNISRLFGCPDISLPPGKGRPIYRAQDAPTLRYVRSLECAASYAAYESDLSTWDVSHITNMQFAFLRATTFNQDLSTWNTGRVTTMADMFEGAYLFDQPIGRWNTSRVTDMSYMFNGATSFDHDLSAWNTENVTDMSGMFSGAHRFNQDISRWNTSRVTSMRRMFAFADAFDQDISSWNTENVTDFEGMFSNTSFDISKAPKNYIMP